MTKINGSIVLSKRIESDGYSIVSSAEDIVRFKAKNPETGIWGMETSPQILEIQVYKDGSPIPLDEDEGISVRCLNQDLDLSSYITKGGNIYGEEDDSILYLDIQSLIENDENLQTNSVVFICEYETDSRVVATKGFQLRDGVGPEMATFEVTAAAINQSVGKSQMSFTQDGLTINDGGFVIQQNGQQVFGFETTTVEDKSISKLTMKGAIYAEEGRFKGEIHATDAKFDSGTIGGFNISQNRLISTKNITVDNTEKPAIELDGENGTITAHQITLGDGAKIKNQLTLGNASLFNPIENGGKLLQVGSNDDIKILLNHDGTASIGSIKIDGAESKIEGENWSLTPSLASFSNVSVSGSIKTAVFETETTQAVGGAMVFLPSYKIREFNVNNIQLEGDIWTEGTCKIANGSLVWLVDGSNNYYQIVVNVDINNQVISRQSGDEVTTNPVSLINLGLPKNRQERLIMGINSGDASSAKEFLYPRGLTITKYSNTGLPNLFLGDLSGLGKNYSGYGLYGDNVYLNGSLTTRVASGSYAGVNTLTEVSAEIFSAEKIELKADSWIPNKYYIYDSASDEYILADGSFDSSQTYYEKDTSNIVFWAGAKGTGDVNIQSAPFQVTEDGSVYASRMTLTKGLITDSVIRAGEIHTAKLRGNGSALSIYDTSNGIQFMRESDEVLFSIKESGLWASDMAFVNISGGKALFTGKEFKTESSNNYLSMTTNGNTPVLRHMDGTNSCGLYFEPKMTHFKMGDNEIQTWDSSGTALKGKLTLNGEGYKLEYEETDGGRNLYVVAALA